MYSTKIAQKAIEYGNGILRLAPTWVPRSFCRPGRRIKLHNDDYYVLGLERGGIDERWFSSTTRADNGPGTPSDEGLSYVVADDIGNEKVTLAEAVDILKHEIVGEHLWKKYGGWPMYSKFFDNAGPLPHHIHHREEHARLVGEKGKPEMYFFPSQLNNHPGEFGFTFFGLNLGASKDEVKKRLMNFAKGDNKLLDLSRCYTLALDTGWDVPPGLLHAPGSLCTYEPQFASDVYAMYQSVLYGGHCVPTDLIWKNMPENKIGDYDYLIDVIDWELNVDPDFYNNRFMKPEYADNPDYMISQGYVEEWVCYKCSTVSAKRLTVLPGKTVTIKDKAAYGMILLQGYGKIGGWNLETPTAIRYGQMTYDEFFITHNAANDGVVIRNNSNTEPIVMLKHFAENPELDEWRKSARR